MARYKPKGELWSGVRFRRLKEILRRRKGIYSPGGLAASIGRKIYGKERFQQMAAAGRRHR